MTHHVNGRIYRNYLHAELHELLCSEAEKRNERKDWQREEREAMLEAVNGYRSRFGKSPVVMADVQRVEQMAVGHIDYGTKFALYCAELVQDRP